MQLYSLRTKVMTVGFLMCSYTVIAEETRITPPAVEGPTLFVYTQDTTIRPGAQVVIEVYVNNVADLSVFQAQLAVTSARRLGKLEVVEIRVEKTRTDFALGQSQIIAAADQKYKRAGALRMTGGATINEPRYLATFILQASADAGGVFEVNINLGAESFINDSGSVAIDYTRGPSVTISVEKASPKHRRGQVR